MRTNKKTGSDLTVTLSRDELAVLNNALNEACHGLDLDDFDTRMGATKPEVLKLLHRISEALSQFD